MYTNISARVGINEQGTFSSYSLDAEIWNLALVPSCDHIHLP